MIERMQFVINDVDKAKTFYKNVRGAIDQFQNEGFIVEIQYQHNLNSLSALIIGRKANEGR